MDNDIQLYQARLAQELWAHEVRQGISADIRLKEHYFRNQMDLKKREEAEKRRLDLRKEKQYQRLYLIKDPYGELVLIDEQFQGKIKKNLSIWELEALRLRSGEDSRKSVLYISFLFGPAGTKREIRMFLDEQRLGQPHYVNQIFASKGVEFRFGKAIEADVKKRIIEKAQEEAADRIIPEIPGWYRMDNQWKYAFPDGLYWKEVTRWIL